MKTSHPLHSAFVLHTMPYKDNSLIVELFTEEQGRLSAVAKGARRNTSPFREAIQLFKPIVVAWVGKRELVTLTHAEIATFTPMLVGKQIWCGLYLNELLIYLLGKHDAHPALFRAYQQAISGLNERNSIEPLLRYFEKSLLEEIGYGLELRYDSQGNLIKADHVYHYIREKGPVGVFFEEDKTNISQDLLYKGESLLALATHQLGDQQSLQDAKRLLRQALVPLLQGKSIQSRKMFIF